MALSKDVVLVAYLSPLPLVRLTRGKGDKLATRTTCVERAIFATMATGTTGAK